MKTFIIDFLREALSKVTPWKMWPTHWAGGSYGVKVDGHNTVWVESEKGGIICRLETDKGRVTDEIMERAALIAKAPILDAKVKTALFVLNRKENLTEEEKLLLEFLMK